MPGGCYAQSMLKDMLWSARRASNLPSGVASAHPVARSVKCTGWRNGQGKDLVSLIYRACICTDQLPGPDDVVLESRRAERCVSRHLRSLVD